ncbi:MAG TPA: hypothetical protein PKM59_08425 [Thermodesulfobacteriota bacterium]|nr:hypothetical protein [Thermodesulfobacteriota bacterium]
MTFDQHCEESQRLFGNQYEAVHRWMDAYMGTPEYGMRHRKKRHHEAGIQEAVRLFGPEAEAAARQHIISDLKEEGWTEQDHFPVDESDYVQMGFF